MNVFEAVKQSVTTRQAAEHYGIRVGRNGMACCPFHNDKTPSMKLDRRYHCFGCGADVHEAVSGNTKATKYEHLLPLLAEVEDSNEIDGLLILLNTLGGDVEAGLSIAEMIASLSKPSVSLVLGGSHSIGGPLAVSADYSFIVPSGTMVIHPVRSNGMFIGVQQSLDNMLRTQDRITRFLADHSAMTQERIETLMLNPTELVKDVGTLLEGKDAVHEGLINEVGGLKDALNKLHEMINERNKKKNENV